MRPDVAISSLIGGKSQRPALQYETSMLQAALHEIPWLQVVVWALHFAALSSLIVPFWRLK